MGIYMEAFHHLVWATRKREHFITSEMERVLHRYIRERCGQKRVQVHALNGMPDHVHLVASLPATLAPADFIETIKGASAHFVNHLPETRGCLYWQEGYGWLTFALNDLPRIVRYVDCQKERHAVGRLSAKMEHAADWETFSRSRKVESREAGVSGVRAD